MVDYLLRDVLLVDGGTSLPRRADVALAGDRVIGISPPGTGPAATETIVGDGRLLCPGFVDLHTHSDFSILHHAGIHPLLCGVTTELVGLCGYSMYPVTEHNTDSLRRLMAHFSFTPFADTAVTWYDLAGWAERVAHSRPVINLAPALGHGTLREAILGPEGSGGEQVVLDRETLQVMVRQVECLLEQGAWGLTTGLVYPPGRNAPPAEIRLLAEAAGRAGGLYVSHIRNEGPLLRAAVLEFLDLLKQTGAPGLLSHHKATGEEAWGKVHESLSLIEAEAEQGLAVLVDSFPFSRTIAGSLGSWFFPGLTTPRPPREGLRELLADPARWTALRDNCLDRLLEERRRHDRRREALAGAGIHLPPGFPDRLGSRLVTAATADHEVPPTLREILVREGRPLGSDLEVLEALRWLYLELDGEAQLVHGVMSPRDVERVMTSPVSVVATDGWALDHEVDRREPVMLPHPRQYGSQIRFLKEYGPRLGLAEAVRRVSSRPAAFLGLPGRGRIEAGYYADLVLLDTSRWATGATYWNPQVAPAGVAAVWVNGVLSVRDGCFLDRRGGRVLLRGR